MEGKKPLDGAIWIQGSKNAALPILAACMLIPGRCVMRGCPSITDIECMCSLLKSTGADVKQTGHQIEIDTRSVREYRLPQKYVSAMRSSVVLMGAVLGRLGEVHVNYPGAASSESGRSTCTCTAWKSLGHRSGLTAIISMHMLTS